MQYEIRVDGGANQILYEGIPTLRPVLERLNSTALLIGGLATAAWIENRPIGLQPRVTNDLDLGINRVSLTEAGRDLKVRELLIDAGFSPGYGDEPFRFSRDTSKGPFVVDLLIPSGSSREQPPQIEAGLESVEAPGLAYALSRGSIPMDLILGRSEAVRARFNLLQLDAAFVMKAALVASGRRVRQDRRNTDTVDAVMLAAACLTDAEAIQALSTNSARSEPKKALNWLATSFPDPKARAPLQVAGGTGEPSTAAWSVEVASRLTAAVQSGRR